MKLAAKLIIATTLAALTIGGALYVNARAARVERAAEAAYPPEGQIVQIGDISIHAVVLGDGPDLVLIHGASGNTRDFTFAFAGSLADRYRVIVLDRPGFGWSSALPAGQGSIFDQAAVLQKTAQALGADRPIVLGHSYGGAVALAWATTQPDTLAALVTSAAASNVWDTPISRFHRVTGSRIGRATVVPVLTAFTSEDYVATAISGVFAPQDPPEGYASYIGAGLSLRRETLHINGRERTTLKDEIRAMVPNYAHIEIPVEIVHGDADPTVSLDIHSRPLALQIEGANLTILPGIGHMPHHADPTALVEAIDRAASRAGLL
ncbi:MAG: alpha/beta hydrolase [Pseudomonadota bacterium]